MSLFYLHIELQSTWAKDFRLARIWPGMWNFVTFKTPASLSCATKASFLWSLFHQIPSQFALFPKNCDEEWIDMLIFQLKFTNYMLHNCIHPEPIRLYIYWTHIQGSLGSCHVQNWHPYPRIAFSPFVHFIRTASNTLETPDFQVAKIAIKARIVENRHWLL